MSVVWVVPKELLEGVSKLLSAVPPRNGIKASEYIKVTPAGKDGASFTLSSEMTCRAMIRTGEPFPFAELFLDRRLFIPFVDAGKEQRASTYSLIVKENGQIVVKHGHRKALYEKCNPVNGYEDLPDIGKAHSSTIDKRWIEIVEAGRDCATDDPIMPNYNCVYMHPTKKHLEVYASNGFVVFRGISSREKAIRTPIAFPLMLVDALTVEGAVKLHWTNKIAMVDFPKGKIWQAVKIQARKNFPISDIRTKMKECEEGKTVLAVNSSVLSEIANRISLYVAALAKDSLVLTVRLTKGDRKVILESGPISSKFQETLEIMAPAAEDFTIEWPLEHVLPTLLYIKSDGVAKIKVSKDGHTSIHSKTVSLIVAKRKEAKKKVAAKKSKKKEDE